MFDFTPKTDFPSESAQSWRSLVDKGLRGAPFETLIQETADGIIRGPLMRAEDLPSSLAALGRTELPLLEGRSWHIAAPVRNPNLAIANTQLLDDLKGGASAVRFESELALTTQSDVRRVLEGVYVDLVPIHFAQRCLNTDTFKHILDLKRLQSAVVWASLDPIRDAETLKANLETAPQNWRLMGISPLDIHEAGGTDVQEIAGMAAALAEAMRLHGGETVCSQMVIEMAADRDTHLTIAKFRTARRVILRIAEAFGADGSDIPLCAVTSLRMMQTEDAWTNLLRVMSAGLGAVLGGADMVTTRPFTDGLGQATPFAHRIARNMQLMMMEESHLGQVSDAAFGSYWHEAMTDKLAQAAWSKFQFIEAAGGMSAYENGGALKADIEISVSERKYRSAPILGVTLHPAKDVKAPEVRS